MSKIYQLSDYGRSVTWVTWKSLGGCGIPNNTMMFRKLKPISTWNKSMNLGTIEDACPFTGRSFARFAVDRLKIPEFAKPYIPYNQSLQRSQ